MSVTPTRHWLEYVDWAAPILAEPLPVVNGTMTAPERPGTGIRWDDAAVARYRAG
jgi:mandelate racemase